MQEILNHSIFSNTVSEYLVSLVIFLGGMLTVHIFKRYVLGRLKKWADSTDTSFDKLLVNAIEKFLVPSIYLGIFYAALHTLVLSAEFEHGLKIAAIIVVTILAVRAIIFAVNFGLESYLNNSAHSDGSDKQLRGIRGLVNFAIWMTALIFMLDNMGVKISAVVAGLGVGGIAVALAAQAVLGDIFGYFVIFFDKPFAIGDFIVVGDKMGAVEYIGIKTTRIRAIGGEILIFSNKDLTNSRVHNFKKMEKRRVVFKLGMVYQTPAEKLKTIPAIVKCIIEAQEDTTFDRGHFASYGDSSLNFEFVYYVNSADYTKYMDIQQAINLDIFEAFEKEKIAFAYPTQTVFVSRAD